MANTTGTGNTAVGTDALLSNTTGFNNTALGQALGNNTTGSFNTATGTVALFTNTTGVQNTATGSLALQANDTGNDNTAMGFGALGGFDTTGSNNTAIGSRAGANLTTGNNNIHIANAGLAADTALIRIGSGQTATFIAGIFGQPVAEGGLAVVVDSTGKLGTSVTPPATPSSRRVKVGIHEMDGATTGLLKLRPISFRYTPGHGDDGQALQYGLIAEEVAEIYPELVALDKDGEPSGVRYHVLPAMLLNELQWQHRRLEAEKAQTEARLAAQQQEIDELRAQVRALVGGKTAVRE